MKAANLIKFLHQQNCALIREGANHSIFQNQENKKITSVPRHKEIKNNLVRKICRDLEIPNPSNFDNRKLYLVKDNFILGTFALASSVSF